jgi:hypothetical protein
MSAVCREHSLPGRRGLAQVVCLGLCLGCHGKQGEVDASTADAAVEDLAPDKPVWRRPEAAIGYASGQACEVSSQCMSQACTRGVCSEWSGVMRISIDTTPSGAKVEGDVSSFPLLVRLNATNFTFGEARDDGADIRFVDEAGNNLGHEIERWRASSSQAEIWVLVPRIQGNSKKNQIFMYWGNPNAIPATSGPSVFASYLSVFHMTDVSQVGSQNDVDASVLGATTVQDSSGNGHGGRVLGSTTEIRTDGCAGQALALDGKTRMRTDDVENETPLVSISLWLNTRTTLDSGIACFASLKGDSVGTVHRDISVRQDGWLYFADVDSAPPTSFHAMGRLSDGNWHYLTAQVSDDRQSLFIDGEPVANQAAKPFTATQMPSGYWCFGESTTGIRLTGAIDEVRIADHVFGDDWVRLSFATQRPGSTAVVYER